MDFENPGAAPRPSYALPIVALVLSILGLCFCPLALVGMILGIVAWSRINKEPLLPGKGLAIAATFVPVALIPVAGILAAVAIPSFIQYTARAKQLECDVQLRLIHSAQQRWQQEHGAWATTFEELGVEVGPDNRYSYFLSPTEVRPANASRHPEVAGEDHPAALQKAGVQVGSDERGYTAACVGNVDGDDVLDVWSLSSEKRATSTGAAIAAGAPFNDVNDVEKGR